MKRRWFQIHLSTAIVLILMFGILLRLQIQNEAPESISKLDLLELTNNAIHRSYGWPYSIILTDDVGEIYIRSNNDDFMPTQMLQWRKNGYHFLLYLALDTLICLLCVSITGATLEYLIRRREARKR